MAAKKRSRGRVGKRVDRVASLAALVTLTAFCLSLAVVFPTVPGDAPRRTPDSDGVTWATPRRSDIISRETAFSEVLASRGYDPAQIQAITSQLRMYRSPRALRSGMTLLFSDSGQGVPDRIRLELTPDSVLYFVRQDSGWAAQLDAVPFVMDTVRISGVIETSLWAARLGGDLGRFEPEEFEGLVYDLADVFAWKVDFTRDLRPGDEFRVVLERKVRPDRSVRSRHFLAIELRNGDRILRAFPQPLPGERYAYFDEEGHSLHGAFLRYPVPYRITSRFTNRRYHPVLKRYRPHEGIDYGAPTGTPVAATASGVVTRAGYAGGYGLLVELRHPQGIRTRYAHLRTFAPGIRSGAQVTQGQIIGRVGSSGLATGPHLHYEFVKDGRQRNPLTVEMPSGPSIAASRLPQFRRSRDTALAMLAGIPAPADTRVVSGPDVRGRPSR